MPSGPMTVVFRLPRTAYLVILFLFFGAVPLAFTASGSDGPPARVGIQTVLILVPVIATVFVARTATIVDAAGITVRLAFGSRTMAWDGIRGLSVTGRNVYAVLADGSVRLPCLRVANLADVSRASDGRLPEIARPTPKQPPQRRRR
ncbi:MAG: PH domain-containing protein [Jatrophihabitans sp.]